LAGAIFAGHNADPGEIAADRCGLRHLHVLNAHIQARMTGEGSQAEDFVRRYAADMMAFQMCFGWRRFKQLPGGRYAIFSQDQYLYSPYRATLFAAEMRGAAANSPCLKWKHLYLKMF
jgi:hypothetical protein